MNRKQFRNLVCSEIKKRGLSARYLAKQMGVSDSTISMFKKGTFDPNHDFIVKIDNVLGLGKQDEALAAFGHIPKDVKSRLLSNINLYEKIRND